MSLEVRNIVNGECDMMKYYSIGMKLNDVIKDEDTEQVILENISDRSILILLKLGREKTTRSHLLT